MENTLPILIKNPKHKYSVGIDIHNNQFSFAVYNVTEKRYEHSGTVEENGNMNTHITTLSEFYNTNPSISVG